MSFSSDTYTVQQYLEPLTPEQLKQGYVHTLPGGRTAVNLKDLSRWKHFSHGTRLIELLPIETAASTKALPVDRSADSTLQNRQSILPMGAVLSVEHSHFLKYKRIYVSESISRSDSVTSALSKLNSVLNEHNRDFPSASFYAVCYLKTREQGTVYKLPNDYQAVAVNSLYKGTENRPVSGTTLLRMQIDDLWHIEAIWTKYDFAWRCIKVYSCMGGYRKGCLGCFGEEVDVLTLMLDVAVGKRSITDYGVEKSLFSRLSLPAVKARLGVGQTNLSQIDER